MLLRCAVFEPHGKVDTSPACPAPTEGGRNQVGQLSYLELSPAQVAPASLAWHEPGIRPTSPRTVSRGNVNSRLPGRLGQLWVSECKVASRYLMGTQEM